MQKTECLSRICLSLENAICERKGKTLTIHPLGDTKYVFRYPSITGEMKTPSIGITRRDIESGVWSSGVMTQEQVIALRNFLDEWIGNN
jgi:hypothetical protein